MRVTSPKRTFKKGMMFGLGWGISYGEDEEYTESFGAMYIWDQEAMKYAWFNLNMKGNMSLDEIRKKPGSIMSEGEVEEVGAWKVIRNTLAGPSIVLHAERYFKSPLSNIVLKVDETRKWAVGFIDGSVGAFSKTMDLRLMNPTEYNKVKVKDVTKVTKPFVVLKNKCKHSNLESKAAVNGVISATYNFEGTKAGSGCSS